MASFSTPITLRRGSTVHRQVRRPWALVLAATVVVALVLLPLLYLVVRAAGAGSDAWDFLLRPQTLAVLGRSAALALVAAAMTALIALPLAWLTVCTDLPWRRFWTVVLLLPLAVPSYISGFAFIAAFGPKGILQQALAPLGIERLPEIYGFGGALLVITLGTYPYMLLSLRATLQRCDPALEEVSRSLGDSAPTTFRRIVLPQLRPALAIGGLLVALYTLSDFGAVSMMRFNSFTRAIYVYYRASFDRENAALLALVLVCFTFVLIALEARVRGRATLRRSNAATSRPRRLVRLGHWRWLAAGYCVVLSVVALGIPVATLCYWLARGLANNQQVAASWGIVGNSLLVAGVAAGMAIIAALPIALLAVRYPGQLSTLLERCSYVGYALPGIVVALALVFFGARYAPVLYQTLPMLLFAYVVLFLPQAAGSIRNTLNQINPRLEDAGRCLGRGPLAVLATVTAPLLAPGMLAGAALVFLTTMKELPATLLLSPTGFGTLATTTWGAASEAYFAQAAAPALLLLAVSALAVLPLVAHERSR